MVIEWQYAMEEYFVVLLHIWWPDNIASNVNKKYLK